MLILFAVSLPTPWVVLGSIAFVLMATHLLGGILGPLPDYRISGAEQLPPNDSDDFLRVLEALADATVNRTGRMEVLTNGDHFYPAALEAIRGAQRSVNLEA